MKHHNALELDVSVMNSWFRIWNTSKYKSVYIHGLVYKYMSLLKGSRNNDQSNKQT